MKRRIHRWRGFRWRKNQVQVAFIPIVVHRHVGECLIAGKWADYVKMFRTNASSVFIRSLHQCIRQAIGRFCHFLGFYHGNSHRFLWHRVDFHHKIRWRYCPSLFNSVVSLTRLKDDINNPWTLDMVLGNVLYGLAYCVDYLYLILIGRIVSGFGYIGFMYNKRYCSDPRSLCTAFAYSGSDFILCCSDNSITELSAFANAPPSLDG